MKHAGTDAAAGRPTIKDDLEPLVEQLVAVHRRWLEAIGLHRAAISSADAGGIERATGMQQRCQDEAWALEAKRRVLCGLAPGSSGGPTLTQLASMLEDPARSRVIETLEELRGLARLVSREQSTVRAASASLLAHMRGVVTQVSQALSHAGVYGRAGRVDAGPAVVSSLDMTS